MARPKPQSWRVLWLEVKERLYRVINWVFEVRQHSGRSIGLLLLAQIVGLRQAASLQHCSDNGTLIDTTAGVGALVQVGGIPGASHCAAANHREEGAVTRTLAGTRRASVMTARWKNDAGSQSACSCASVAKTPLRRPAGGDWMSHRH